jgi:hypothetical protein
MGAAKSQKNLHLRKLRQRPAPPAPRGPAVRRPPCCCWAAGGGRGAPDRSDVAAATGDR